MASPVCSAKCHARTIADNPKLQKYNSANQETNSASTLTTTPLLVKSKLNTSSSLNNTISCNYGSSQANTRRLSEGTHPVAVDVASNDSTTAAKTTSLLGTVGSISDNPTNDKTTPATTTIQKPALNVTLSSNSCSSSLSTSSGSSSTSESSANSSQNLSIPTREDSTKLIEINANTTAKQAKHKSQHLTLCDQTEMSFLNDLNNSGELTTESTNEFSNSNLISVPGDSPSSFKRQTLGGSYRASYKEQKENYLTEKKRITNDMLTVMREDSIIVLADWLKIRGSLKNWVKVYVVLKPGIMLLYKSDKMKAGQWIGTIVLNSCQILERPSKKHGFCFKIFHPLEKSIWASKGPVGETYINVPYMLLPTFYLIFRAPSETIGQIWMDAIELTLQSSHLLKKPLVNLNSPLYNTQKSILDLSSSTNSNALTKFIETAFVNDSSVGTKLNSSNQFLSSNGMLSPNLTNSRVLRLSLNKSTNSLGSTEAKKSPMLGGERKRALDETIDNDSEDAAKNSSDEICSLVSSTNNDDEFFENNNFSSVNNEQQSCKSSVCMDSSIEETKYVVSHDEEFGELGNKGQTEEVDEEDKSLIMCLVKQVRPGMDLSKVVLPTFILEPRSFLEKLTDFYYHSNILAESINNDDPYERMKSVLKFYLSGFYKKPKGLKKPYNPILGEVFRSYWYNPKTDSKTFYIAEQVSHHPPITSVYVSNRKDGFCIYGTIVARSKFYGNSVSAIMEGQMKLILLNRGEEYVISMPYANCKGLLIGKLTMELGGKVGIECVKTGYSAEIEFKLRPWILGGNEASNLIDGKIKFAKETIASVSGKWDGEIMINERQNEQKSLSQLWNPTKEVIESRLQRFIVPLENQKEFESEILWLKVSDAIKAQDQNLATEEKSIIETRQRESCVERKAKQIEYQPQLFTYDPDTKQWIYNHSDLRPWDPQTDLFQYEENYKITTKTKHDLSKLKSQKLIPSPQMSLMNIIPLHHTSLGSQSHSNRETDAASTKSTNENSFDILMQYTEIKQRLTVIEDTLKTITSYFDDNKQQNQNIQTFNRMNASNKPSQATNKNINESVFSLIANKTNSRSGDLARVLTSTNVLVALAAWLVGLLSAIFSYMLLVNVSH